MPAEPAAAADKRRLRAEALVRRSARDRQTRDRLGLTLAATALALPELAEARRVCGYVGVGTEPVTGPLLDGLRARGVEVLLPVLTPDHGLDWAGYDGPPGLATGAFGLREPTGARLGGDAAAEADVLLVPSLAVDVRGSRLGRGGGYYDRMLARLAGERPPLVWAVVYDEEVLKSVPTEPHDVPVRAAVTPSVLRHLTAA